ncbi:MAG: glycosyltransferase family 9 protein [Candidatus Marinimicrobia bacterium]|nr:glycosyltransferase family 9 protein [Candidatus Neomarinimicrobiota bacterium]
MFFKFLERKIKRGIIKILSAFSSPTKISLQDFRKLNIKKIAVVRQDNRIGNLIFIIPLIKALKEDYPDCELHLITGYKYGEILSHIKEVDEIIPFYQKRAAKNPFYYFKFRKRLKKAEYDLVIDAGSMTSLSVNNILLGASARSKAFVGYDRKESSSFLNLSVPIMDENSHESRKFLYLADYLSEKKRVNYPSLTPTTGEIAEAQEMIQKLGIHQEDKIIGINIGGRYDKRWDIENYLKLISHLQNKGMKIFIFSGPDEVDLVEKIYKIRTKNIFNFDSPPMGLLIGLISKCTLFITGDTGPLHLAAAMNIPCVQLFKVDNYNRYGYTNSPHKVVEPLNPSYENVISALKMLI